MSKGYPQVSVIMPVYNGEKFLADAVASVRRQQYPSLEIIVVDDGSSDGTAAIATTLGADVTLARQQQGGPAAARNRGLACARGEFIAFLDVDDLWPDNKLQSQLEPLLQNPAVEVVIGLIQPFGADEATSAADPARAVFGAQLGGAVFRRSAFSKVGLFDPELRFSEDHDWFLRAREQGIGLLALDRVTLFYRRSVGAMTNGQDRRDYQLPRVLKASLDRRRRAGLAGVLPRLADFAANPPTQQEEQAQS